MGSEFDDRSYVDDSAFAVKYKLRHFNKFRIVVAAAVVLCLLLVIFVILFAVEKSQNEKLEHQKIADTGPCNTKACVFASLDIMKQLNQSADPCDDFYSYACGGYISRNPLKEGQTARSGFSDVIEKNLKELKKSLETAWLKYPQNEAVMKSVRFYNSCLDESAVEAQGDRPLKELIKKYGSWNVLGDDVSGDTMERLADIERELDIKPLINVDVAVNFHNSSAYIVQLKPASLGMSKGFYANGSAENTKVQKAYQKYMKTIAKLLGGPADSDQKMMEVYEFEAKLAKIEREEIGSSIAEALKEAVPLATASGSKIDLRTSIKDFSNQTNTTTTFVIDILERIFKDQNKKFTAQDRIVAFPINYFQQVVTLFKNQSSTNAHVIDNYIMWSVVNKFVSVMATNYTSALEAYADTLQGPQKYYRWKTCIRRMQSSFSMSMGFLFVESSFDEQSKKMVEDMTKYIRGAFLDGLESNNWMSGWTRTMARQKALAIKEDIGYPPYIKDPKLLAATYSGLTITGNLFRNAVSLRKFYSKQNLDSLGKAVDKDKWYLSPSQVNGYYAAKQNRIVFLAGILQPPFYNPTYPNYLNYGGIGMVIGHEVTHGFDTSGRMYDKDGNINNWWSPISRHNFMQKIQCLKSQYSQYQVFEENINGNQTVNENIADNGGIKLAYDAYLNWAKKNGAEKPLPGVGLSVDQLFFVGFAKAWCSIYTKEPALLQLKIDSHSFNKYRVIGSLSNFPTFSEAFKCKPGSRMNPVSKCSVW